VRFSVQENATIHTEVQTHEKTLFLKKANLSVYAEGAAAARIPMSSQINKKLAGIKGTNIHKFINLMTSLRTLKNN
jgi:hypothetical protein